jgi:hypothetical protein
MISYSDSNGLYGFLDVGEFYLAVCIHEFMSSYNDY